MTISFIMAAFEKGPYIAEAVRSVLAQDWPEIELVVVDDGSTDDTPEILSYFAQKDHRVRVFSQENRGASHAYNRAMDASLGELILIADADDIQEPTRARLYAEAMIGFDWAYSGYYHANIYGHPWEEVHPQPVTPEGMRTCSCIPGASIAVRRRLVDGGLRYREELAVNYDLGFMIDLLRLKLPGVMIDQPTFRYRLLQTGMSYARKAEVEAVTARLQQELNDLYA